jgi:AraC-like DNA-binding protein
MAEVVKLLNTAQITVGTFHCPPGDVAWRRTNYIGDRAHVVFPSTPVVIHQRGKEPILTTPNHTVLYNAEQLYERELRSERGDECVFICLSDCLLRDLAVDEGVTLVDAGRLGTTHTPTHRKTYLAQHLLARRLRARQISKRDGERVALELVRTTLKQPLPAPRAGRGGTGLAHRALAEAAKAKLSESLSDALPLRELARSLHTSPFHLARVFRAETGFSVSGYRCALRLRVALARLDEVEGGITQLALELGFASHSHFTDTFRREFGIVPSVLRGERLVAEPGYARAHGNSR